MVAEVPRTDAAIGGRFHSALASEWNALADEVNAPPWLRPRWLEIWWGAFGGAGQLVLLTARRGEALVGVAPMVQQRRLLTSPTNYHSPTFGFLALDQEAADDLAVMALRSSDRAVAVSFLDGAGPTQAALLNAARESRHLSVTRTLERPPYVTTQAEWTEYEERRGARLLRDLRRRERRLAEAGQISFEVHTGRFDLDGLLEDCFRTEAASWKGAGGTAMNSTAATRRFYTEIAEFAHARGELMLAFLRLDDRPIAAQFNIDSGGTVTVLKLGHDEEFDRFAPGKLLIRDVLSRCFRDSTTRYDFSGHSNPYKMEWADGQRELVETRAFAPSLPGLVEFASRRYARPLVKRLAGRTA